MTKMGQKNRPFVPLIGCDGDVDGVGVAFAVNDGFSLRVNLDRLDGLDFPLLLNGAVKVGLAG